MSAIGKVQRWLRDINYFEIPPGTESEELSIEIHQTNSMDRDMKQKRQQRNAGAEEENAGAEEENAGAEEENAGAVEENAVEEENVPSLESSSKATGTTGSSLGKKKEVEKWLKQLGMVVARIHMETNPSKIESVCSVDLVSLRDSLIASSKLFVRSFNLREDVVANIADVTPREARGKLPDVIRTSFEKLFPLFNQLSLTFSSLEICEYNQRSKDAFLKSVENCIEMISLACDNVSKVLRGTSE